MNWITKTDNESVPAHVELMFYTRFQKTLIGVRIGQKVKCGGIDCDVEDITHYGLKPNGPQSNNNSNDNN